MRASRSGGPSDTVRRWVSLAASAWLAVAGFASAASGQGTVRGRLLDGQGRPLAARDVHATLDEWTEDGINVWAPLLEDDGAGGFRIVLTAPSDDSARSVLLLEGRGGIGARLEVSDVRAGIRDLGDVRLSPPPLLVAGRVLGPDGEPVRGARVLVERPWSGTRGPAASWMPVAGVSASTDEEGRFELRGWVGIDELRVVGRARGLATGTRDFRAGDASIELALTPSRAIRGTLLLDARCGYGTVEIAAVSRANGSAAATTYPTTDGSFLIPGLDPGTYDLHVRTSLQHELLAAIDGVLVRSGEDSLDPRAAALDLRGKVLCVEIRLVTPAGADPPLAVLEVSAPGGKSHACQLGTGTPFALASAAPAVDIMFEAKGWRIERLKGVTTDQVVTLRPGIPVRLALQEGLPALPTGYELRAWLEPVEFELPRSGDRGVPFDARGTALLRAADPGPHRARLQVRRLDTDEDYTLPLEVLSPSRVDVEDAPSEKQEPSKLDAARLAELIEKLERQG